MYYTADMVDWFAVVDMTTKKIAWIPINNCGKSQMSFRHGETDHGRYNGKIRWFDDYTTFPFATT